jgi:hypothetical protein
MFDEHDKIETKYDKKLRINIHPIMCVDAHMIRNIITFTIF